MGKIDFWPLLIKYIDTLRNYQTNKISLIDIFVQLIVPALLSVALFFNWPDSRINLGDLISNLISCHFYYFWPYVCCCRSSLSIAIANELTKRSKTTRSRVCVS